MRDTPTQTRLPASRRDRVRVRKNTGTTVGPRSRLNFIEGTNVTLTVADDPASDEVDITITSSGGGGGGAPTTASYVVMGLDATLTAERVLAVGSGLTLTDGGAGGNATLNVAAPGIVAGTYGADPTQTLALDVNVYGQVTNYTAVPIAIDMAQVSQNTARLLGRTTAGYGITQELTVGTGLTLSAGSLSLTTPVALANGGTAANLSGTGGAGQVLKQATLGGAVTVGTVAASEIASGAALTRTNDTNVTLTLGGSPTTALLAATSMTLGWSGTLGLARGGTAADLSATGGAGQVLKQATLGGAVTVGTVAASDIASGANFSVSSPSGAVLSLSTSGTPTGALLKAAGVSAAWSGNSGGIPYFSGTTTMGSTSTLSAGQLVIGGGAGIAPATSAGAGTVGQLLHAATVGNAPTWGAVDLASATQVTGLVGVVNGGTGTDFSATISPGAVLQNVAGGDLDVGTLPIAFGGTGQTTASAAFAGLSPLTTRGDLLTRDGTGPVRKAIGAAATYLRSDGTDPQWAAATANDDFTQYLKIGGRSSTGNDTLLSNSQGGILAGSSAAGAYGLKLRANSNTTYATSGQGTIELWDQVTTISNIVGAMSLPASLTFDNILSTPSVITVPGTAVWTFSANTAIGALLFNFSPTIQNNSGSARSIPGAIPFYSGPKYIGANAAFTVAQHTMLALNGSNLSPTASTTGASGTATITDLRGYLDNPYLTGGSTGTNTVTITRLTDIESVPSLDAPSAGGKVTIGTRRGLWFRVAALAGAGAASLKEITDQAAVEVEDLSSASYTTTTLCSLRSAGSSVQMRHAGAARFGANSAPVTTLDVRGGYSVGVTSKSANYTLTASDCVVLATAGAGGITLTLPSAANTGQVVKIIKVDTGAGAITIQRAGADAISRAAGAATVTSYTIAGGAGTQYAKKVLIADGSATWHEFVNL